MLRHLLMLLFNRHRNSVISIEHNRTTNTVLGEFYCIRRFCFDHSSSSGNKLSSDANPLLQFENYINDAFDAFTTHTITITSVFLLISQITFYCRIAIVPDPGVCGRNGRYP